MLRALTLVFLTAAPIVAPPALATTQDDVLQAALRSGWQMSGGAHMAALDLRLAPGWKTYWRSPGDAGIPPQFDWSGSENLQAVRVHWPAPTVFETNGMQSIGYHDQVILPLEVVPVDPARPVRLALSAMLGICDTICIPATLVLRGELLPPGADDAGIKAALAARAATAQEAGVGRVACSLEPIADGLRLTARIALPDPGALEVVAIETRDPQVWVAETEVERIGGDLVAVTDLVPPDGTPFALDRSGVTLTILANGGAVEVKGCPAP